ncbi:hypothetical protein BIFGAL_03122 [Bifidobacterium gallicum DSM 20093 = LMG 11596]|uniref:Uncharacterized protein n=2 Tax=Bifidobacterium gallicum TaxID=78342 RepID=D1NTG4_9BIFI|nr:hypothetical protein BIFGAL_03122 [Bifidobacterium gallicum DSM 20093 = LMG 11596]
MSLRRTHSFSNFSAFLNQWYCTAAVRGHLEAICTLPQLAALSLRINFTTFTQHFPSYYHAPLPTRRKDMQAPQENNGGGKDFKANYLMLVYHLLVSKKPHSTLSRDAPMKFGNT